MKFKLGKISFASMTALAIPTIAISVVSCGENTNSKNNSSNITKNKVTNGSVITKNKVTNGSVITKNKGTNVVWIGIDGFSANVWKAHKTPNIEKIMSKSAYSLTAQDIMPSKTYPNWSALLTSQKPNKTGVERNPNNVLVGKIAKKPTKQNNFGKGVAYSIFDEIKKHNKLRSSFVYPLAKSLNLTQIVNPKSVDNFQFAEKPIDKASRKKLWEETKNIHGDAHKVAYMSSKVTDEESVNVAGNLLVEDKSDFIFSYVAGLDIRGHIFGWGSKEYLSYMNKIDEYIGELMEKLKSHNQLKNTIFVLTSDHGGVIGQKHHGGDTPDERTVPIIIYRGGNEKSKDLGAISNLDVTPTISNLLGLDFYNEWEGKVLKI